MFKKKLDRDIERAVSVELDNTAFAAPALDPSAELVQISEYHAAKLGELLTVNRRHESELSAQLADITEKLRQTRLVIKSLEPAQALLAKDVAA